MVMARIKEKRSAKYPDLTLRQEAIYDFLRQYMREHPYPPTVREIQHFIKVKSTSTVQYALDKLEKAGYISKANGKMRTIVLCREEGAENTQAFPVVGKIAAGEPIFADENITDYIPLPSSVAHHPERAFILEVKGESMINAGILNGDYVIVEQCDTAENGEIIAALIEDSATVKRFYKDGDHIRLQPENPDFEPIILHQDFKILGRIVGLYRNIIH